jgi:hypothetical protein
MAGPSVAVRVIGDLSALGKSFDAAVSKGASAASGLRSAFSGTLAALNKTGVLGPFAGALDGVDQMLGQISEHGKATGAVMMGVGGTLAGVGVALSAMGSKEKASHEQLKAAIEATGASYDTYAKRIDAAEKHNEHFGYTSHETADALRVLTSATGSPTKALGLLSKADDLAAFKHISLTDAATKLGKVYNGNAKILKEFGLSVTSSSKAVAAAASATKASQAADAKLSTAKQHLADIEQLYAGKSKLSTAEQQRLRKAEADVMLATANATSAHEKATKAQEAARQATLHQHDAVDALGNKLKGQASAAANTFSGHLKAMTATVEDAAAKFGEKYGPAITVAGTALASLGGIVTGAQSTMQLFSKGQEAATAATDAMTTAEDAEAVSSWAALGPLLLIIAGIAALVVAGYVIYRNWKTIWNGIHVAVKFVWDWIKEHWPLLLGILTGPIGLAVLAIIKYRDQIWDGIKAVWSWIQNAWQNVYQWLMAPVHLAVAAMVTYVHWYWDTLTAVWNWIASAWQAVSGWISGPIHSAASVAVGAFQWLSNTITGVWNWIANNFSKVYGWITGPFNDAINFVKGLWDGLWSKISGFVDNVTSGFSNIYNRITGAFRDAINGVISVWNGLSFTMGGWTVGVGPLHYTFPQYTFGLPHIQPLETGGVVRTPGLFELHAGEAVTPAKDVHSAPSVWIENLTVAETLDVDAFMRRAAWAVQRERI